MSNDKIESILDYFPVIPDDLTFSNTLEDTKLLINDLDLLSKIIGLTDLTSLNQSDTLKKISLLASKAKTLSTHLKPLAAVCIPGDFVSAAKDILKDTPIKIATVVNFPSAGAPLDAVLLETKIRLEQGVDEIDLVFPLAKYLSGDANKDLANYILQIKNCCLKFNAPLKTIIQSDEIEALSKELSEQQIAKMIYQVAIICLNGFSDMIKTSTGKGAGGASLRAAAAISCACFNIAKYTDYIKVVGHYPGIKLSGGVSDPETALKYINIFKAITELNEINSTIFRFGSSKLVAALLERILSLDNQQAKILREAGITDQFFKEQSRGKY
jgi:deoxyribose-phosphate aldolase